MAGSGDQPTTRELRLAEFGAKLEAAVEDLITGDDWMRAIQFAAKFRSRSFGNTLLIYVQHMQAYLEGRVPEPQPTFVAGFKQWKQLRRSVDRGQSGYAIFAPITRRFASSNPADPGSWRRLDLGEKARPGEVVRTKAVGTKPAYVWDVSQTSGAPIPEQPAPQLLKGQAPAGLWDGLGAQVEAAGYALTRVAPAKLDGANGRTDIRNRTVEVRADLGDAAAAKTLAHELAHVTLHAEPDGTSHVAHRGVAEVEAESVALMIGASYGMDTADYSVPYVATWSGTVADADPLDVVRTTGERVRRAALAIIDQLPDPPIGDGLPPGFEHDTRRPPARTHDKEPAGATRAPAGSTRHDLLPTRLPPDRA